MKKKFVFPNTYVIIILMMIVAVLLTWIIPSGEFERVKDEVSKQSIIIPGTFKYKSIHKIFSISILFYISLSHF